MKLLGKKPAFLKKKRFFSGKKLCQKMKKAGFFGFL